MKFLTTFVYMVASMAATTTTTTFAQDIPATAATRDDLTTLVALLGQADLVTALEGDGPFTVFAPTDKAFALLPQGVVTFLTDPANADTLSAVLQYHVAAGEVMAASIVDGTVTTVETLQGESLTFEVIDGEVTINNDTVTVTEADIGADNGVIHIIDGVLVPPSLLDAVGSIALNVEEIIMMNPMLSALAGALADANLTGALADPDTEFTVFAPNDAAFDELFAFLDSAGVELTTEELTGVLLYHVVPFGTFLSEDAVDGDMVPTALGLNISFAVAEDGTITVIADESNATVVMADMVGTNGVVHIIDAVLLPSSDTNETDTQFDVGDVIAGEDDLTILTGALRDTGLLSVLDSEPGPITIFAPTDAAFAPLLSSIANLSPDEIVGLLLYHVVGGNLTSDVITDGATVQTALGEGFTLTAQVDEATGAISIVSGLTTAMVVEADLLAENGVVHKINSVLLPSAGSDAPMEMPIMPPMEAPMEMPMEMPMEAPMEAPATPPVAPPPTGSSAVGTTISMVVMATLGAVVVVIAM